MTCTHKIVLCLNEYELIRKYRCEACSQVMMCACDREIGERFLAHQLGEGCVLETQERVPVTLGFVEGICRECRGLPPEAHPTAAIPGRTSKIQRYYWREVQFETFKRFAGRAEAAGFDSHALYSPEAQALHKEVQREVLEDIKQLHATNPKYAYKETSQAEVLAKYEVEEVRLDATFAPKTEGKGAGIIDDGEIVSAEEFAARHYRRADWQTMFVESTPFHVLFGIYMWLLIQDAGDPLVRVVSFGSRTDHKSAREGFQISTFLPSDFGTPGYAERRANAIEEHLSDGLHDDLEWLFDYWLDHSSNFREYLWAHREGDVRRARQLIDVLPADVIIRILRYLVGNYWGRFTGWPDLLIHKDGAFFFAEVKASKDKLSEDQKRWIADNATKLRLPLKLIKIHRVATQSQI
jgi:hypothetical protein